MSSSGVEREPAFFHDLYARSSDPWRIEDRWYERRKRALILASLPFEHARTILEPGCGGGALSAVLAARCDHLIACDISPVAIDLARQRVGNAPGITFSTCRIPQQWPALAFGSIDCVVLSEIAYYLDAHSLSLLVQRIAAVLAPAGVLVACHWKRPFAERTAESKLIHSTLADSLQLHSLVHHDESDFVLDVWSGTGKSVAMQEGFA